MTMHLPRDRTRSRSPGPGRQPCCSANHASAKFPAPDRGFACRCIRGNPLHDALCLDAAAPTGFAPADCSAVQRLWNILRFRPQGIVWNEDAIHPRRCVGTVHVDPTLRRLRSSACLWEREVQEANSRFRSRQSQRDTPSRECHFTSSMMMKPSNGAATLRFGTAQSPVPDPV